MEEVKRVNAGAAVLQNNMTPGNGKNQEKVGSSRYKTTSELISEIQSAKIAQVHTIYEAIEASKRGYEISEYQGVALNINHGLQQIILGVPDKQGDIITVKLTNGYRLCFQPKDIDGVKKCLSLFSPEDVRRILEGIAEYNHRKKKLAEIEEEKAFPGEEDLKSKKEREKQYHGDESSHDNDIDRAADKLRAGSLAAVLSHQQREKENEEKWQKKALESEKRNERDDQKDQLQKEQLKEAQEQSEIKDELIQLLLKN